jgi:sulfite exporter TauE/SafE
MDQVWLAFITGLTTGGISCLAVQGGLLASSLAHQKDTNKKKAVVYFLLAKLVAYSIVGALLGMAGSFFLISPKTQGWMQIFAGIIMLATVGRLLDLHPVFRRLTLTPPKSIFRFLKTKSLDQDLTSSVILGFLTILIPCGVTQAMMLLSIASGSAVYGGLILFAFTLGTTPIFLGLGLASNQIFSYKPLKIVAILTIFTLGIISINTGQILRGSVHTLQNYWSVIIGSNEYGPDRLLAAEINADGTQEVVINVTSNGYVSDTKTLMAGVPVRLKLITTNTQGCSRAFNIPELGISKILPVTGVEVVEFTPNRSGRLSYTCSMGMFTGWFDVI